MMPAHLTWIHGRWRVLANMVEAALGALVAQAHLES